jgi:hypothetical protein
MNLKTVWCEWDIGQHGLIFANEHVAERWLRNNVVLHDRAYQEDVGDFDEYYQKIVDDCLIGIDDVEIIE